MPDTILDPSSPQAERGLSAAGRLFLRDYISFAGRKAATALILAVVGAALEGVGLALLVPLFAVAFYTHPAGGRLQHATDVTFGWFGVETPFAKLSMILAAFAALMMLRTVFVVRRSVITAELQIGFVEHLRLKIASRLAETPWDKVVHLRHARITHLMSGDIQRIGAATLFFNQGVVAVVVLVIQMALAFMLSPPLALLMLLLFAAGAMTLGPMLQRTRGLGGALTNTNLSLQHTTSQFLGGLKQALSQNLHTEFITAFRDTVRISAARQAEYAQRQAKSQGALMMLLALVAVTVVLVGYGVFAVAPAVLTTILIIASRISGPAGQLQTGLQQLAHALPAYEAMVVLENELAATALTTEAAQKRFDVTGAIKFDDVTFLYPAEIGGASRGVQHLSLTIHPGECIGVVGASGAGKTTFADLLVGLFPPQSGVIYIGDEPLISGLAVWRQALAYVPQDPYLLHDTIRHNLTWAHGTTSEEDMWKALECVEAAGFVRAMADGLDTVVGERGMLISGGERQRIALARALLRWPRLLVLDEATSALDPETEQVVLDRLTALSPRPSIVIISHRPTSLARCERIVTMADGQILSQH